MVRKNIKSIVSFYLKIIVIWVFAWLMFYVFRHWGVDDFPYIELIFAPNRFMHISIHIGLGIVTGLFYASLELVLDRSLIQRRSYGQLILIKMVLYLIIIHVLLVFTVVAYNVWMIGRINWLEVTQWCSSVTFLTGIIHFLLVSILISIFKQINYKFGPGIFWNMLKGKYHQPREEERIFMFLDLKSSTTIAENLGHIRFSKLIQDCFYDLTDIVLFHEAEIYQYVGDEVILSWKTEKGLRNNSCLAFYFDFMEKLNKKKGYYESEYKLQPFFKAGIHLGKVTVAEVGVIKKDIAYLGDVLNTTARIQGRCNALNQAVLISRELKNKIKFNGQFIANEVAVELLKGKQKEVAIFGIEKAAVD